MESQEEISMSCHSIYVKYPPFAPFVIETKIITLTFSRVFSVPVPFCQLYPTVQVSKIQ